MATNWYSFSEGTVSTQTVPQAISAYFRKPSKVTKPNSRNQSPRNGVRRRMTTQLPSRTRSVHDPQMSGTNSQQSIYKNAARSRPTSWHPNFLNEYEQYQIATQQFSQQPYQMSPNTMFAHGFVEPSSFPALTEQSLDCRNHPLGHTTGQDSSAITNDYQHFNSYTCDFNVAYHNDAPVSNLLQPDNPTTEHMGWLPASTTVSHSFTHPMSPEFLPMPDLGQSFDTIDLESMPSKDELVGMGLYDSPSQVQSARLLFSGSLPVRRKSLKLEEAFEPVQQSESEEDDDNDDDDDDDAEFESTAHEDSWRPNEAQYQVVAAAGADQKSIPTFGTCETGIMYSQLQPQMVYQPSYMDYQDQSYVVNPPSYNWF